MFRRIVLFLAIILVAAAIGLYFVIGKPTNLTATDAGRQLHLRPGQTLQVTLEGNPTTGYNWLVVQVDEAVLKQVGEPEFKADSAALGAGGKITLRFQAVAAGNTGLLLAYKRPWEKDVPPEKTFTASVVVRKPSF